MSRLEAKCEQTRVLLIEAGLSNIRICQEILGQLIPGFILGLAWCLPLQIQNLMSMFPKSRWSDRQIIRAGYAEAWAHNYGSGVGLTSEEAFEKHLEAFERYEAEARAIVECVRGDLDPSNVVEAYCAERAGNRLLDSEELKRIAILILGNSFRAVVPINSVVGW